MIKGLVGLRRTPKEIYISVFAAIEEFESRVIIKFLSIELKVHEILVDKPFIPEQTNLF